ncbi:UNKNOWN [Stylonychia lemnae]|uniref:Uncharacterized protein n=1 Tax=Stylonychia lemnae TaxID=5949 RepID=A0A078A8I1_STYLE|nr:UNKNOWN [Stylonychia lemnae]|eukprot:CDW78181.1 UNKNOWN [Stylonychia lemnae]
MPKLLKNKNYLYQLEQDPTLIEFTKTFHISPQHSLTLGTSDDDEVITLTDHMQELQYSGTFDVQNKSGGSLIKVVLNDSSSEEDEGVAIDEFPHFKHKNSLERQQQKAKMGGVPIRSLLSISSIKNSYKCLESQESQLIKQIGATKNQVRYSKYMNNQRGFNSFRESTQKRKRDAYSCDLDNFLDLQLVEITKAKTLKAQAMLKNIQLNELLNKNMTNIEKQKNQNFQLISHCTQQDDDKQSLEIYNDTLRNQIKEIRVFIMERQNENFSSQQEMISVKRESLQNLQILSKHNQIDRDREDEVLTCQRNEIKNLQDELNLSQDQIVMYSKEISTFQKREQKRIKLLRKKEILLDSVIKEEDNESEGMSTCKKRKRISMQFNDQDPYRLQLKKEPNTAQKTRRYYDDQENSNSASKSFNSIKFWSKKTINKTPMGTHSVSRSFGSSREQFRSINFNQ